MRRAPKDGYDKAIKRDYRRKTWATFRETLKSRHISVASASALLMPSLEGDEISHRNSASKNKEKETTG